MKKISKLILWLAFLFLAGLFVFCSAPNAKAASPSGPTIYTPRFYSPDNDNIYFNNQSVKIHINYHQSGLRVTADLTVIDKTMSASYPVRDNKTGTYTLITPVLSGQGMVVGQNIAIPFTAVDETGKTATVNSTYLIETRFWPVKDGAKLSVPARLSAQGYDSYAKVWWTSIPGADKIAVFYTDEKGVQRQINVSAKYSGVTISNLQNGYLYTFKVAGRNSRGNIGPIKTVQATPAGLIVPAPTTDVVTPTPVITYIKPSIGTGLETEKKVAGVSEPKKEEVKIEETPVEESSGDENKESNWNRIIVAISILIIASGAAIGGYYGYEWWIARKEDDAENHDSKKESNKDRW